jgi:hypothetical protein
MVDSREAPKRIQRKRTKGWKMPPNTVYVGRPTRWGNPFWHAQRFESIDVAIRVYRAAVNGIFAPAEFKDMGDSAFHIACEDLNDWNKRFRGGAENAARYELRGKDLACWCPLDQPCHADMLLEIANG